MTHLVVESSWLAMEGVPQVGSNAFGGNVSTMIITWGTTSSWMVSMCYVA